MITGKNYIGKELSAQGSTVFRTINPKLNLENAWECTEATVEEIGRATALAKDAFKMYRNTPSADRAHFLNTIADEIEALGDELIDTYCQESGLPKARAEGERGRTVFQLRAFAEMLGNDDWKGRSIDLAIPDRQPLPKVDLRKTMIPMGPIAVFGSSNFPFAYSTAGGDTASALAAGCPVIVKSHPMHAGTGELVASAIIAAAEKTNMPNGVFSNLNSKGIEVGVQLVQDAKIKAVGFTGSIRGGRALLDIAAGRPEPIPVFAEMGSLNPVIITQKALEKKGEHWADIYASTITMGTGQFCTNPGLILGIESDELDAFAKNLAEKMVKVDPTCMLHPNIKAAFSALKQEVSSQDGVSVLSAEITNVDTNYADQCLVTVSGSAFLSNPKLHNEVFGPFSLIVKCKNQVELLEIIEGLEGQLTGTIIAEEEDHSSLPIIVDELQQRVGRVIFNGVPTGVEVCPSMNHGGPYPASTDARFTAVGIQSIKRWIRPVTYQSFPKELLPNELKNG
ncbi:MAG: aldehyde dehydrogenase (NADP(+)) [Crocinitomicaceae bacterium]|nr:aldehyde dehydrogenase (NADP(+)) [Crocinitomicaceae bacterium]